MLTHNPPHPPASMPAAFDQKKAKTGFFCGDFYIEQGGRADLAADFISFFYKSLIVGDISWRNLAFYARVSCLCARFLLFSTHRLFLTLLYIFIFYLIEKKEEIIKRGRGYRENPVRGLRILLCSNLRGLGCVFSLTRAFSAHLYSYKKQILKAFFRQMRGCAGKSAPGPFFYWSVYGIN